jgi:hypothetical protein
MNQGTKVIAWMGGAMLFIMALAAWSRVSTMKEPGQLISGGATAIANLFKGVLK